MNRIDDWAVNNVMPALDPSSSGSGIVSARGLWRPFPLGVPWWQKVLDLYNYPGSVLISAGVLVAACIVLLRRRDCPAAILWTGAWLVANAVELLGKHVLSRPSVHWSDGATRITVTSFNNSYPSGHTVRSVLVAAIVAYAWPRLRWPAAVWLLLVPVSLVIAAAHTVSDVVGGLLLGLVLMLAVHAMIGAWIRLATSSGSSSSVSSAIRSSFARISRAPTSSSPTRS
jgi:membrane-associated phospholipid phosphatase